MRCEHGLDARRRAMALGAAITAVALAVAYWSAAWRVEHSRTEEETPIARHSHPGGPEDGACDEPGHGTRCEEGDGVSPASGLADASGVPRPLEEAVSYSVPDDLPHAASQLLDRYEQGEPCVLAAHGYMDLLGHTWACVVEGPGWVDVCVVRESGSGDGSVVRSVRLEPPSEGDS